MVPLARHAWLYAMGHGCAGVLPVEVGVAVRRTASSARHEPRSTPHNNMGCIADGAARGDKDIYRSPSGIVS